MLRTRFRTVRLLALLLPATMLWVFVACTLQCVAAAELACREHVRDEISCCRAEIAERCEAGEAISSSNVDACAVGAAERGILTGGDYRPRVAERATAPESIFEDALASGLHIASWPVAHAPPGPRPLDRLPTLLI
jgi:hypothetical protein